MAAAVEAARVPLSGGRHLDLSVPRVMGVLNVTPDSFSDGGRHLALDAALAAAERMIAEGAAVIDVGGESTRPGATPVDADEERRRVLPVIEALAARGLGAPISIDTRKAAVARDALAAGATIVNDVTGLGDPAMAGAVAEAGAAVVIGHIQGLPETMQADPRYGDVVGEVHAFLAAARERAVAAGVASDAVLVDPGIGFGKRLPDNLALIRSAGSFADLGPVVVGVSRKSFLGTLLDERPVDDRLAGGLGAAVAAVVAGARLVRTHDVRPTVDALRVAWAIGPAGGSRVA